MRRGLLLIAAFTTALAVAGAASSRVVAYSGDAPPDPAGDSGRAPDLTTLSMANDDAGKLTWRIGIANRSALAAPDLVFLVIDADWKETGSNGFEFLIQVDPARGTALAAWNGSEWQDTQSKSVAASFAGGVLEISVDFRELKSENVRFEVFSLADSSNPNSDLDVAPNGSAVFAFNVKVPLLFDSLTKPKKAVAGKTFSVSMSAWTDGTDPATSSCRARVGKKTLKAKASSASVTLASPSSSGPIVTAYKSLVLCSVSVPRNARGKTVSVQVTALRAGVSLTRSFTVKAR